MNFIKKNKLMIAAIIAGILLIISIIFSLIIIINPSSSNGVYGNRLTGIENVIIKNETIEKIKTDLNNNENISNSNYHLKGRTMKFTINLSKEPKNLDNISNIIKESFKEELKYYDIQILYLCETGNYPIYATLHKTSDTFSYTIMSVGDTNE